MVAWGGGQQQKHPGERQWSQAATVSSWLHAAAGLALAWVVLACNTVRLLNKERPCSEGVTVGSSWSAGLGATQQGRERGRAMWFYAGQAF